MAVWISVMRSLGFCFARMQNITAGISLLVPCQVPLIWQFIYKKNERKKAYILLCCKWISNACATLAKINIEYKQPIHSEL